MKAQRDAAYKMMVDLTETIKTETRETSLDDLLKALGGYMQLMNPPNDAEEISVTPNEIRQTALLAAQALSRLIFERVK